MWLSHTRWTELWTFHLKCYVVHWAWVWYCYVTELHAYDFVIKKGGIICTRPCTCKCWIVRLFSFLIFWGTAILFFTAGAPFYILVSSAQGFQFLHIIINTYFLLLFLNSHHNVYEMVSHCGCDFHFSSDLWYWASVPVLVGHACIVFVEMSIQVLGLFFSQIFMLFIGLLEFFIYSGC